MARPLLFTATVTELTTIDTKTLGRVTGGAQLTESMKKELMLFMQMQDRARERRRSLTG